MTAYNMSIAGSEFLQEGYVDKKQWQSEYDAQTAELETVHSELLELRDYLSEDNQAIVDNFNLDSFKYINELEETNKQFVAMRDEALAAKEKKLEEERQRREAQEKLERQQQQQQQRFNQTAQQQSYSGNSSSFKSQGVIYQNGTRYTYYSSNVLYHYRTPEWTAGRDGIYRDSSGYIVVASNDYAQGAVVSTPFGAGKVYDSGCASGTIDIYTNF